MIIEDADTEEIAFDGTYKPIITTKKGYKYKIEADKISLVNIKGEVLKGCNGDKNTPCTATLKKIQ